MFSEKCTTACLCYLGFVTKILLGQRIDCCIVSHLFVIQGLIVWFLSYCLFAMHVSIFLRLGNAISPCRILASTLIILFPHFQKMVAINALAIIRYTILLSPLSRINVKYSIYICPTTKVIFPFLANSTHAHYVILVFVTLHTLYIYFRTQKQMWTFLWGRREY